MGCSSSRDIGKEIKEQLSNISLENDLYRKELKDFSYDVNSNKGKIIKTIQNKFNENIIKEIKQYYNLLSVKKEKEDNLNSFTDVEEKLKNLLDDFNKKSRSETKKEKIDRISKKYDLHIYRIERLEKEKGKLSKPSYTPKDVYAKNIDIINDFYNLENKIDLEIIYNEKRKTQFSKDFNSKMYGSFEYPKNLQENLKNNFNTVEKSFPEYEKNLNYYSKEIKNAVIKFINDNDIKQANSSLSNLKNNISILINKQKNLENESLSKKENDISNALKNYRQNEISSKIKDLKNLSNKIMEIKNKFDNRSKKYKEEINSINQKENNIKNKFLYVAIEIKNKDIYLNSLGKEREAINKNMNSFNNESSKLNEILKKFNSLKKDSSSFDYLLDFQYEKITKNLRELKSEMEKKLGIIEGNNSEEININEINLEFQNSSSETELILNNTFYNTFKQENFNDPIYNEFVKKEKKVLTNEFNDNRRNIENIILNSNINIPYITKEIIKQIIKNEQSTYFFRDKIIEEIDSISNDNSKYKINYLNVLLIGRKGVGKTSLINYILGLNNCTNEKNNTNDFKTYKSQKIKHLRIIEARGTGYDDNNNAEIIKQKVKNYIDNLVKSSRQNYNEFIHCIWYCIDETRFEGEEKSLFVSLKNMLSDRNIMPIIFVYARAINPEIADDMKKRSLEEFPNNSFVITMAEDYDGETDVRKPFGKEELINTTLKKCTEALESDTLAIMIELISKNIKENLIENNQNIKERIINKIRYDFIQDFNNTLGDSEFIKYINDIFFKYLNNFYDNKKIITNTSMNLIFKSDFISSISKIYSSFKSSIKEKIKPNSEKRSKELFDMQAILEQKSGNMKVYNRRDLNEFQKTTEIFLKKSYYFLAQNYIINYLVNQKKGHLIKYISLINNEFSKIIQNLLDLKENAPDCALIKRKLEKCFKLKIKAFSKKYNLDSADIDIENQNDLSFYSTSLKPFYEKFNFKEEKLVNPLTNTNSFIFNKSKEVLDPIEITNITEDLFVKGKNNFKFLKNELITKLNDFLQGIKYQESSFDLNNNDAIYNFLQEEIKKDLINFFNSNIVKFCSELSDNNNQINLSKFNTDDIKSIIKGENIESYFKNKINEALIEHTRIQDLTKLKQISIIIAGRSGIGKSSLINCLLKADLAKEGVYDITTEKPETYKAEDTIPFLKITDTRGYQLDKDFNPEKIKDNVLNKIKEKKENNDINEKIHCIYFCVHGSEIGEKEINILNELKNNSGIPIIIVFTLATINKIVNQMKEQLNNLFPDFDFIQILARDIRDKNNNNELIKRKFGVDDLLNITINAIKTNENNDIYETIKEDYKIKQDKIIKKKLISEIELEIINKSVENFINNYSSYLKEKEFEQYLYGLIEKIIGAFSFKNTMIKKTKSLINDKFKNNISSFIQLYSKISKKYIDMILEEKSLEYLDMQVKIEKIKNENISKKNKKNRQDFKDLISSFLKDNFHYVAQKYLIYRFIIDIIENFAGSIGQYIYEKMKNYLSSKEINEYYKRIYLTILENYEKEVNKFRNENGKIYE